MTESKQAQILEFPYQLMTGEELEGCDDMDVMAFHVRLWATRYANAVYQGLLEPTDELIGRFHKWNTSLRELGHPELPLDFVK